MEQLVRLGQNGFKNPEKVYLNYAEAMALTVFLMHDRGGQYREDFLDYVRDALRGRLKGAGALDTDSASTTRPSTPSSSPRCGPAPEIKPAGCPIRPRRGSGP